MSAKKSTIERAYAILGWKPAASEIRDIQADPANYWGSTVDSIVGRLINSSRFAEQPKTAKNVSIAWKVMYGYEPNPSQLNEVMRNNNFWGRNMGQHLNGIRNTPAYKANPGIKAEQRQQDEALINNIKAGLGLGDKEIGTMSREQLQFFGQIGAQMIDNIEKSIPAPTTFTAKTFQELYEQARTNPNINQYFDGVRSRAVEDILNSVANLQEDLDYVQTEQARQFTSQIEGLQGEVEEAGLLYSGVRQKAEEQLRDKQMGVVHSTLSEARRNLQNVGRQAEEQLGSEAASQLNLSLGGRSTFGQYTNQQVSNMMSRDNVQYQGYGSSISSSDSRIGRAQQDQVQDEYNRLQQERLLLTNPQQMS